MDILTSTSNPFFVSLGVIFVALIAIVFVLRAAFKVLSTIRKNCQNLKAKKRLRANGVFYATSKVTKNVKKASPKQSITQTIAGSFTRSDINWAVYDEPVLRSIDRLQAFIERSKVRNEKRREVLGSDNCTVIPAKADTVLEITPELAATQVVEVMNETDLLDSNYIDKMRSVMNNLYDTASQEDEEIPSFLKTQAV